MAILAEGHDVDLVLSDIDMPGQINGISLSWVIRAYWPDVAVVLVSGRTAMTTTMIPEGVPMLRMPFGREDLLEVVRDALQTDLRPPQPRGNVVPFKARKRL